MLRHLVLDLNGTLADRGTLIDGVAPRARALSADLVVHLLTADTFGTAAAIGDELGAAVTRVADGREKAALVDRLGPDETVAIGNGRNDAAMLRTARLGLVVLGPEGAAVEALTAADVACRSITDALDLLIDERLLIATFRS